MLKRLSTKSPVSETNHADSESDLTSTISSSIEQQSLMIDHLESLPLTDTAQVSNPEECVSSPLRQLHSAK